jgi:hypothetical protein
MHQMPAMIGIVRHEMKSNRQNPEGLRGKSD